MLKTVNDIRKSAVPIAKKYGIKRLFLFGSYARKEESENSDVDFYMDAGNVKSLIQYFSFVNELEDAFGCHVDVISRNIKDKQFLSGIENEGILIYEA